MTRVLKFRVWGYGDMDKKEMHHFDLSEAYHYCHIPVMQYTGLKDSKGVEIYEGDILADADGEIDGVVEDIREVRETNSVAFNCHAYSSMEKGDYQIVGNIHQHPELLNNTTTQAE